MTNDIRAPQAFKLETKPKAKTKAPKIEFAPEPEPALPALAPMARADAKRRRAPLGNILLGALATLLAIWFGAAIAKLIADMFAWSLGLGWVTVAIAAVAGAALLAIVTRELWGLARLRGIEQIQTASARAINMDDMTASKWALSKLQNLYAARPDTAWGLTQWSEHRRDIMDPSDAIRLAERYLLEPLDDAAHRIIAKRARRVTLLTTVTPAAALDIALVGVQNLVMIREIAELYGGRPSFLATLRLSRLVLTHLAVAGGLALTDNFLHLFIGKSLLGKLSARFGEGAINGILTSRIGLAACEVCRPIAKAGSKRESLASLVKEVVSFQQPGETAG